MEEIKLYGINISALALTHVQSVNDNLQTILLTLTIFYTFMNIYSKIGNGKNKK